MKHVAAFCLTLLLLLPNVASAQYVMDLGSLINALRVGDFSGDLENLDNARSISVTRVSKLSGIRIQGALLDRTVAARDRVLTYLRAIIRQNKLAMKALAIHHEALEDVIFLTTTNDGSAMLYVDDR